jgi:CBS domain-containing protein
VASEVREKVARNGARVLKAKTDALAERLRAIRRPRTAQRRDRAESGLGAQVKRAERSARGGNMATARDIMTSGAECIGENQTLEEAAKKLAELDVGSMPICGEDNRLKGMLTDRDIVVEAIAQGRSPAETKAGELGDGKPVTIGADDSVEEALRTMTEHKVRRLPVIDGHDLIGIVSQADVATNLPEDKAGELVEAISAAP